MNNTISADIGHARKQGAQAGERDAWAYNHTDDWPESSNPYGMDSEPELHEAWAETYENSFEAGKYCRPTERTGSIMHFAPKLVQVLDTLLTEMDGHNYELTKAQRQAFDAAHDLLNEIQK
jgi:hypothetical protein